MATISVVLTRVAMLPFFILLFSISPTALSFTFKKLSLPAGVTGPAFLAFDLLGGPYVSVQDGRILKYNELTAAFQDFAFVAPTRLVSEIIYYFLQTKIIFMNCPYCLCVDV